MAREQFGIEWPYAFYGNPGYTAHNRAQCAHFLLGFHNGQLPAGAPSTQSYSSADEAR